MPGRDNGFAAIEVSVRIAGLNLALAALAGATLLWPALAFQICAVTVGIVLVGVMLWRFAHPLAIHSLTETPR
jgi:hypothetical protein